MNFPKKQFEWIIITLSSSLICDVNLLILLHRQRRFLRSIRHLSTIKHRFGPVRGGLVSEKPVPIVILSGETIDFRKWIPTTEMFVENGYNGLILDLPYSGLNLIDKSENRVDNEVNALEMLLRKELLSVPPIVITHSLPTFLIQKYLESYAVRSLFLIDPFPPNPVKFKSYYEKQLSHISENIPPAIHLLFHDIITDDKQRVNLEANSVPMFPIFLECSDRGEKEEISRQFIDFHEIDDEQILRLSQLNSLDQLLQSSSHSTHNDQNLRAFHDFLLFWSDATL